MDSLSRNNRLRLVVSGYHRKVPATWRHPPENINSDLIVAEAAVGAEVNDALDDLIARIQRRRTSDSAELEPSSLEDLKDYQSRFGANVFDECISAAAKICSKPSREGADTFTFGR